MARPKKSASTVDTRERVIGAAIDEFGTRGFAEARLEDIAAAAGIRRASLLHHFPSKEWLYQKALEHVFNQLGARLAAGMERTRKRSDALQELTRSFQEFVAERPAVARILLREMIRPEGVGFTKLMEEVTPLLGGVTDFLRQSSGPRLGNPKSVRQGVLLVVFGVLVRASMGSEAERLWGENDHTLELARAMLLK